MSASRWRGRAVVSPRERANRGLQAGKTHVEIAAVLHRPRQRKDAAPAALGQPRQRRPAGIRQAEQLRRLVECLARRVVLRFAEQRVVADAADRDRAGCGRRKPAARRTETPAAARRAAATADGLRDGARPAPAMPSAKPSALATLAPTSSAPASPGPLRVGDRRRGRRARAPASRSTRFGQRHHAPDVVARGELGHHAAVRLVHRHLRMQRVGQQAASAVVEREAGLVAGGFDAEYDARSSFVKGGKYSLLAGAAEALLYCSA